MPKNRISTVLSNYIGDLRKEGRGSQQIANLIHLPLSTVKYHIKKQRNFQPSSIHMPGRPKCTKKTTDSAIVLAAKRVRTASKVELAHQFGVSRRTIRRRLSKEKMKSCLALEEDMTPRQKRARIEWCNVNRVTNFQLWLFSDESSFELADLSIPRRSYVHRKPEEKYARCCIQQGGLRLREKLMVWGCITAKGPACFDVLRGNINAQRYVGILCNTLIPYLESVPLASLQGLRFQQDNAPPHRALITRQFLESEAVDVPEWPPLSPDLNPIEDVWALMKKEVRMNRPRTLAQLEDEIRAAWRRIVTPDLCKRLYRSMPNRMKTVLSRRGSR